MNSPVFSIVAMKLHAVFVVLTFSGRHVAFE